MGKVFFSIKSSGKTVHLPHCRFLRRIPEENVRSFESLNEAIKAGYRLCNCCPSIAYRIGKEKDGINSFCNEKKFKTELINGALHITSALDSWQIITYGSRNALFLYHKNTGKYSKGKSVIPGYHLQKCRYDTIMEYLRYINSHDIYRREHPLHAGKPAADREIIFESVINKYKPAYTFPPSRRKIRNSKKHIKEQTKKERMKRCEEAARAKAMLEELEASGFWEKYR